MATTSLSAVSAALSLVYGPQLTSQINNVAVLPYLLPVIEGEGKALYWTAEFSGASNAGATADGVALSSSDADAEAEVGATLGWAQYTKVSSVSDLAQAGVQTNFNPGSVGAPGGDLLMQRVMQQGRRVALGVATHMYSGNPGASPTQLAGAAIAIDSSGTFAGIDPTTYTEWASVEQTVAAASLTLDSIRNFITAVYDSCGYVPEFITCDSIRFNAIRALFTDYEANVAREVKMGRGGGANGEEPRVVTLQAGMRAIEVDQVPIVMDRYATASTFYAWNSQFVSIRQLPPPGGKLYKDPAQILELFRMLADNPKLQLPREQLEGMAARSMGLRPHVKLLGDRGMSKEAVVAVFGQVEWRRRNAFGKLTLT